MRKKIAVVTEIPTPYRDPVFACLAQNSQYDFSFFFLSKSQRDRAWGSGAFESFPAQFLNSHQWCVRGHHTIYYTRGVRHFLIDPKYDGYVIWGYAQPAMWKILRHCWKNRIPYVMGTESHFGKRRSSLRTWIKQGYLQKVYGRSESNLVMSTWARDYVQSYGAKVENIFLFPNSVDGVAYSKLVESRIPDVPSLREKLGLQDQAVILFVGALNQRKGVDLLISAFENIRNQNVSLVLAGEGECKKTPRIKQVGFVQPADLPTFYALADLFVLPSREEPFGAVVCEAAAAGLPIITSDAVGASADFVKNGVNGKIFPSGSTLELYQAMTEVLESLDQLKKMGQASRKIMESWTHEKMAHNFIRAVSSALHE